MKRRMKINPKLDKFMSWVFMIAGFFGIASTFITGDPISPLGWVVRVMFLLGFWSEIAYGENPNRAIVRLRYWQWRWHQWRNHRAYVAFCDHRDVADKLAERWWPEMMARQKKEREEAVKEAVK